MAAMLALNLAPTLSAWACGEPRSPIETGSWRLPRGPADGPITAAVIDALSDLVKVLGRPAAIVITAPFLDDVDSQEAATRMITTIKMVGAVETYAFRRSIPVTTAAISDVRRSVLQGTAHPTQAAIDAAAMAHLAKLPTITGRARTPAEAHAALLWSHCVAIAS